VGLRVSVERRTAAKAHSCQFCGGRIEPGEKYGFYQGTPWSHPDNDTYFSWKGHLEPCWKAWDYISQDVDGYLPGDPYEWRSEYLDGGNFPDADPRIRAAWLKVTDEIEKRAVNA
jgi:hypothetical protein